MSDISIIILVTACSILFVGFIAFLEIFFPKVKNLICRGNINYLWLYGIIGGIFIFLTYPYFFNLWARYFWNVPADVIDDYTKLGALGDIYGSLNTLFTSATLIIVIYSTLLQRQANKDAREAMLYQLKQAEISTSEQLKQAKKSTEQQLKQAREGLDAQLEQAKQTSADQLALARETHDAQMKESRYSVFSNMFYALVNQKQASFNNLKIIKNKGEVIPADKIFYYISKEFLRLIKFDWKNLSDLNEEILKKKFDLFIRELNNNQAFTEIYSYFGYYISLLKLIDRSEISDEDKEFFRNLLTVSISASEQLTLLWISSFMFDQKDRLTGSGLFDLKFNELTLPFIVRFFDKSCFSHPTVLQQWDKYSIK